ncbi:MAG TPA: 50S ribosomal protein L29 [Polyangiaceae bacterium]|jgi:large subunit ribosomal protein L29|nr:50S ribosomal protein L29 [Polyangiaceae bacterium]
MKAKDLRERATTDLVELRDATRKELFQGRMKNCTNQLEDTSLLGKARKDIARIDTILRERAEGERAKAGS